MTRLALLMMVALAGGCLGIEGTDVSTGAAPGSDDDGEASLSGTYDPTNDASTDPSTTSPSTTDPGTTDPSGTDDGPVTATDTNDPTDDESTGGEPTSTGGAESGDDMGESSSATGDIVTEGTDSSGTDSSGTDSSSSESGSESTGDACGDGEIQVDEQCDGDDLQGFDCFSLGFEGGVLACDPLYCTFDTSACEV